MEMKSRFLCRRWDQSIDLFRPKEQLQEPILHHLCLHISAHNEFLSPAVTRPSWLKLRNTCGVRILGSRWLLKLWNLRSNICLASSSSINQSVALPGSKCWIRAGGWRWTGETQQSSKHTPSACGLPGQAGWLLSFLSPLQWKGNLLGRFLHSRDSVGVSTVTVHLTFGEPLVGMVICSGQNHLSRAYVWAEGHQPIGTRVVISLTLFIQLNT